MTAIPLIRAGQIKPFSDFLNRVGAPLERLMKQARLPVSAVDEPDTLISYYALIKFLDAAALSQGIPDLGVRVAQQSSIADIGTFGKCLLDSPNLYRALVWFNETARAFSTESHFWLVEQAKGVWFCRQGVQNVPIGKLQDELYTLMFMINIVRLAAGPCWRPSKILLQSDAMITESLKVETQCETQFCLGQLITAFPIPRPLLASPLQAGPALEPESPGDDRIGMLLTETEDSTSDFTRSLRTALRPFLGSYQPNIQLAAEISGLSVRTVQRRLAREGLTFRELLDQIRLRTAMHLIEDVDIGLGDIAREAGYSDSAHFNRAFHRWTGTSPSQYRLQQSTGA